MPEDQYAEFRTAPGDNLKKVLSALADELLEAEQEVKEAERVLELAKERYKDIAEHKIPDVAEGLEGDFSLGDGRKLTVKEEIRASIAGERREPAIRWMDQEGYGHIVKRKIVVEFGKGEEAAVARFLKTVSDAGYTNIKQENTVHPQTLMAWVREQLSEGVNLPVDVFGIFRQRIAKVKGEKK